MSGEIEYEIMSSVFYTICCNKEMYCCWISMWQRQRQQQHRCQQQQQQRKLQQQKQWLPKNKEQRSYQFYMHYTWTCKYYGKTHLRKTIHYYAPFDGITIQNIKLYTNSSINIMLVYSKGVRQQKNMIRWKTNTNTNTHIHISRKPFITKEWTFVYLVRRLNGKMVKAENTWRE